MHSDLLTNIAYVNINLTPIIYSIISHTIDVRACNELRVYISVNIDSGQSQENYNILAYSNLLW